MLATVAVLVTAVAAFNVLLDPLGVFASPRISGLNAIKPYLDHHRELARMTGARRVCAEAGIFGNSRATVGFDPESPALAARGLSAFNHAIAGTNASSSYRQFLWLKSAHCFPGTIILGVEFFDFLGGTPPRELPTLQTDPPPAVDTRFLAETLLTLTGLRDSVATLLLQRSSHPARITDRGFIPLDDYIPIAAREGYYGLFRQRAEQSVRRWSERARHLSPAEGGQSDDALSAILDAAREAGSTTYIVIYPYHAEIRLIIERLGMAELFADWKRLIVANAERHGGLAGKIEVWDFSGLAPETLEKIPEKGDRKTQLAFYWEAGHFKKALGDLVLARLLGRHGEFGIRIDSENIDSWLAEDRRRIESFIERR